MKSDKFVTEIINLREGLDYFDHFSENITLDILNENKYKTDREFNDEFKRRSCVIGTYYSINYIKEKFENEIENLIINYNNPNIFRLLNGISFLNEILVCDELYVFGSLDSYICYTKIGAVSWNDSDTLELLSPISNSQDSFLDCMFELAYNNINCTLSNSELLNKLIRISGEKDSELFYKYLLGFED
jgi:hypothetical protein